MPVVNTPSADPTVGEFCVYVLHDGDQYNPSYIGITTRGIARRFKDHCKAAQAGNTYPVYEWMRNVGIDNVSISLLESCESELEMYEAEVFWIRAYRTTCSIANVSSGGRGARGFHHTDESKAKISNAHLGKVLSDETKARMSQARIAMKSEWYKPTLSSDHRRKIGEAITGERNPFYGKTHSEETKHKISETKKRNPSDVNHRRWHTNRGLVNPNCVHCGNEK